MKSRVLSLFVLCVMTLSANARRVVEVTTPGSLASSLSEVEQDTCTQLVVKGCLNSADIRTLRRMGGFPSTDGSSTGHLMYVDLSDVSFVTDKSPYLTLNATEEHIYVTKPQYSLKSSEIPHYTTPNPLSMEFNKGYASDANAYVYDSIYCFDGKSYFTLNDLERKDSRLTDKFFYFGTDRISRRHWTMVRMIGRPPKGHKLHRAKDGRVSWMSYATKGEYSLDMFYKCPNVKVVLLPRGANISNRVAVKHDPIRYFKSR